MITCNFLFCSNSIKYSASASSPSSPSVSASSDSKPSFLIDSLSLSTSTEESDCYNFENILINTQFKIKYQI